MHLGLRSSVVAVLLMLTAACGGSGATAPSGTSQASLVGVQPVPPVPPTFPPLSGPSRTLVFDHALGKYVSDYTVHSQFVLYDDGAFILQFPTVAGGDGYRGGYTEANGTITFEWEGWNIQGPWGATGTLNGNSMTVQYNPIMQGTDFEDAVYVLAP